MTIFCNIICIFVQMERYLNETYGIPYPDKDYNEYSWITERYKTSLSTQIVRDYKAITLCVTASDGPDFYIKHVAWMTLF